MPSEQPSEFAGWLAHTRCLREPRRAYRQGVDRALLGDGVQTLGTRAVITQPHEIDLDCRLCEVVEVQPERLHAAGVVAIERQRHGRLAALRGRIALARREQLSHRNGRRHTAARDRARTRARRRHATAMTPHERRRGTGGAATAHLGSRGCSTHQRHDAPVSRRRQHIFTDKHTHTHTLTPRGGPR